MSSGRESQGLGLIQVREDLDGGGGLRKRQRGDLANGPGCRLAANHDSKADIARGGIAIDLHGGAHGLLVDVLHLPQVVQVASETIRAEEVIQGEVVPGLAAWLRMCP